MTEQAIDKLNRTDLIKLVAQEALAQLEGEVDRATEAVDVARAAFESAVRGATLDQNMDLIERAAVVCSFDPLNATVYVPRAIYAEVAIPDTVTAVIVNSPLPFDQRVRLEVRTDVAGTIAERAHQLQAALVELDAAEHRDTKVSTIKESVRKDLVAELLKGEEGAEVLAAAKRLAAAVKARMVG